MNPSKKIASFEEYEKTLAHLCYLIDSELSKLEKVSETGEENHFYDVIDEIPKLLCMVNSIGYLRGKDGSFSHILEKLDGNFTPFGDFAHVEDDFEVRLGVLMDKVNSQPKYRKFYEKRLKKVFTHIRRA